MKTLLSILLAIISYQSIAQFHIDTTFNHTAYNEFTHIAGNIINGNKVLYTKQNDLIVAGKWLSQISVWKYKQDGSLDPTFGFSPFGPGMGYMPVPNISEVWITDAQIQNDGKIVVLADGIISAGNTDYTQSFITIARFNTDGTPDTSFNHTGLVVSSPYAGSEYETRALDIAEDGTIYVCGSARVYGNYHCVIGVGTWFVASYTSAGTLNTSFNGSGIIEGPAANIALNFVPETPYAMPEDLKLIGNGRLQVAGAFHPLDSALFVLKLKTNGTYDSTYGTNGIVNTPVNQFPYPAHDLTSMKILKNNSMLLMSNNMPYLPGQPDSSIVNMLKLDANGRLDNSFATNGTTTLRTTANRVRFCEDKYGRLNFAWYNNLTPGTQDVYFFRYFANGKPDNTFGKNGKYGHHPIPNDTYMNADIMQDIAMNSANSDITLLSLRSATYVPNNSFRIINYIGDSTFSTGISILSTQKKSFEVYPNPCTDNIRFTAAADCEYAIYSLKGSLILSASCLEGENEIRLPKEMSAGAYTLLISNKKSGTVSTASFIKQN